MTKYPVEVSGGQGCGGPGQAQLAILGHQGMQAAEQTSQVEFERCESCPMFLCCTYVACLDFLVLIIAGGLSEIGWLQMVFAVCSMLGQLIESDTDGWAADHAGTHALSTPFFQALGTSAFSPLRLGRRRGSGLGSRWSGADGYELPEVGLSQALVPFDPGFRDTVDQDGENARKAGPHFIRHRSWCGWLLSFGPRKRPYRFNKC